MLSKPLLNFDTCGGEKFAQAVFWDGIMGSKNAQATKIHPKIQSQKQKNLDFLVYSWRMGGEPPRTWMKDYMVMSFAHGMIEIFVP